MKCTKAEAPVPRVYCGYQLGGCGNESMNWAKVQWNLGEPAGFERLWFRGAVPPWKLKHGTFPHPIPCARSPGFMIS